MGFGTMLKANKAYREQKNGNSQAAMALYEECFNDGLNDPRYVLAYAVLLIRDGQYQKAKDFLVKHQKAPGMSPEQRTNLIVDYAACCYRLGDLDKAVAKLEEMNRKGPSGLIYQTLGYLYCEQYDAEKYKGSLPGFVRSLVDIDEDAVQEKFGEFLSGGTLNHEQQEFVREIIDYLRENGEVTPDDLTNDEPFANYDITNLFADRMDQLRELLKRISDIDTGSAA